MVTLYNFLNILLQVLMFAIIGRAIISWFDPTFRNSISRILFEVTEPILAPIRSIMPRTGMMDFSPIIAWVIIYVLQIALSRAFWG